MKLILQENQTDKQFLELVDMDNRCPILIASLPADSFLGTDLENSIEHAIEQQGFADITIKVKEIK